MPIFQTSCDQRSLARVSAKPRFIGVRKPQAPERRGTERTELNGVYVCGEVFSTLLYVPHLCRALLCEQQRATHSKRQAAPQPTACDILHRPGYPFTPFNSVQLRSKGGWSFSRGYRTCLAGSEQVTNGYISLFLLKNFVKQLETGLYFKG